MPKTTNLDLVFKTSKESKLPTSPRAWIYIKESGSGPSGEDLECITPSCASLPEINEQVDRLIGELEAIRKKAKAKFAEHS